MLFAATVVAIGGWQRASADDRSKRNPVFEVDAAWPKPLPAVKDAQGAMRQQASGGVGTHCIDSHDHVIQFNRRYVEIASRKTSDDTVPAAPVVEFDPEGNVVNAWGESKLTPQGMSSILPHNTHGCSVDYQDNIWVAGNADGIVQKWSHDGRKMLLQIGTKGVCDGPPTLSPKSPFPTCGASGNNASRTLLNQPSKVAVDPNPDRVTG